MSGHSKWATIKRKKGAIDAARGKLFTKLIREITIAARIAGGDADANPRLRKAVSGAKHQGLPKDTIARAIARGSGGGEGAQFDEVLYEGSGPGGTLFMVEGATDNRNRSAAELRKIFDRHNGQLGQSGTAGWAFDRVGSISLERAQVSEEQLLEAALSAGAEDYRPLGELWVVYTPFEELDAVSAQLEQQLPLKSSCLIYLPKNKKLVSGREAELCLRLADALDDHDDVQSIHSDFDISDEEMEKLLS